MKVRPISSFPKRVPVSTTPHQTTGAFTSSITVLFPTPFSHSKDIHTLLLHPKTTREDYVFHSDRLSFADDPEAATAVTTAR